MGKYDIIFTVGSQQKVHLRCGSRIPVLTLTYNYLRYKFLSAVNWGVSCSEIWGKLAHEPAGPSVGQGKPKVNFDKAALTENKEESPLEWGELLELCC